MLIFFFLLETNEAGDPEQIFSTEEIITDLQQITIKEDPADETEERKIEDVSDALSNVDKSMARDNDVSDHPSMIEIKETSTLLDSLKNDFDSFPSFEDKDCEYLETVMGFKRMLVLPDAFFTDDLPICYCPQCVSSSRSSILKG